MLSKTPVRPSSPYLSPISLGVTPSVLPMTCVAVHEGSCSSCILIASVNTSLLLSPWYLTSSHHGHLRGSASLSHGRFLSLLPSLLAGLSPRETQALNHCLPANVMFPVTSSQTTLTKISDPSPPRHCCPSYTLYFILFSTYH